MFVLVGKHGGKTLTKPEALNIQAGIKFKRQEQDRGGTSLNFSSHDKQELLKSSQVELERA